MASIGLLAVVSVLAAGGGCRAAPPADSTRGTAAATAPSAPARSDDSAPLAVDAATGGPELDGGSGPDAGAERTGEEEAADSTTDAAAEQGVSGDMDEQPPAARPVYVEPADTRAERTVPRREGHERVRDEVAALVEEAAAGTPRMVILRMRYIWGWGCDCPPFWFPNPDGGTEYDDEYILPVFADGVPNAIHDVRGEFRLTGHFTGRRINMFRWQEEAGEPIGRESVSRDDWPSWEMECPEFHVHEWCYEPPHRPLSLEYEAPEMAGMRTDGAPLCPGDRWPAWIDEPQAADAS